MRRFIRRNHSSLLLCLASILSISSMIFIPDISMAQDSDKRVMWQLDCDPSLSKSECDTVQSAVLKTLSRAKERHFVGNSIVTQKIKKEGLNFPECFTEGKPCSAGGSLVLDVHNVDAFAKAKFSKVSNEWQIELKLYQNNSASAVNVKRSSPNLENLMTNVTGSLFEMESMIEVTSQIPDIEVYINEKLVGLAPLTLKTPVGEQKITFKKSGYVTETWEFVAEKGKVHTKELNLEPEKVQLTILVTDPAATVDINGQAWGNSNESHEVLPGNQKIDIHSQDFEDFSMDYKVYAGNPQTIHVALLPKSEDPYVIRHRGISKYRLSMTLGYHLGYQSFSLRNSHVELNNGAYYYPPEDKWASTVFHGLSLGFNYEAQYWGIGIFKFDFGGSGFDKTFEVDNDLNNRSYLNAKADGAMLIGFYPAQIKAHYTFWVMQAELTAGVGLSHLMLWADIDNDAGSGLLAERAKFSRTAFSMNLDLNLKFFFSEESFVTLGYDFQYDFEPDHARSSARHGVTIALGYQFPFWMRDDNSSVPEVVTTDDELNSDTQDNPVSYKLED